MELLDFARLVLTPVRNEARRGGRIQGRREERAPACCEMRRRLAGWGGLEGRFAAQRCEMRHSQRRVLGFLLDQTHWRATIASAICSWLRVSSRNEAMKSTTVAYLLWCLIFVGFGGIHRIYAGRWVTGLIWLFTGGLFLVGQVIDLFLIPGMIRESNLRMQLEARR